MRKSDRLRLAIASWIMILFPSISWGATLPTVEEMRGILYICSQGYSKRSGIEGSIEADAAISKLLRNLEAGAAARGEATEREVGAIIEKTFTEEGAIQVHTLYHDCLNRHLVAFMSNGDLSGPGVQQTKAFTLFAQDAKILADTAIVVISAKFHRGTVGWFQLEPSTFKAVSSDGGIFRLVDDGGLGRGFTVGSGDQLSMTLIFERVNDRGKSAAEDKINISGTIDKYVNKNSRESNPVGLRDIPVRKQ